MKKFLPLIFLLIVISAFFAPFLFKNKLPIPSDTIVGLYHPFRDLYSRDYPNGIPFKNFLITDPVRQQYPWKVLAIAAEKKMSLPLWNPYNFAGTPLLGNFQSGAFYPLNILLFVLPFEYGWSILILLQPLLAGSFLYLYLKNLKLNSYSSLLGAISFAFCGFSVAWLEWGTIGHTAVWLPLVLLSIDKIFVNFKDSPISNFKFQISNIQIKFKKYLIWALVFLLALTFSFFAGHLQTFFYLFMVSVAYFFMRWFQHGKSKKHLYLFLILSFILLVLTSIQWLPTLNFINLSARGVDQSWKQAGWFIPWQNLVQFVAPDFFGNPTTLNYWGIWNYGEFVGYIGILPLIMSLFAIFKMRDRLTFFFAAVFLLSLIFSLPTILAMIPFQLHVPFLSSAQPTRLLFLTDFSLAVLASLGCDLLISSSKTKQVIYSLLTLLTIFGGLWIFVLFGGKIGDAKFVENLIVAKRNLLFPTILFAISVVLIFVWGRFSKTKFSKIILFCMLAIVIVDLLRFGSKFTPFTSKEYLFPTTKTIDFLQKQKGQFRIMSMDDRIFPPNFSVMYHLQTVEGYDPLYLLRYGELIAASERGKPDINAPFGFNRIITPHNIESRIADLLGVKYVLSLSDIKSSKLQIVFEEGKTKIYKNNEAYERVFFVDNIKQVANKQEAMGALFDNNINLKSTAIIEGWDLSKVAFAQGSVSIVEYKHNNIVISAKNTETAFLVLVDTFYPTWHAKVCSADGDLCNDAKIYRTNYNFRGVVVPEGEHKIFFENRLL